MVEVPQDPKRMRKIRIQHRVLPELSCESSFILLLISHSQQMTFTCLRSIKEWVMHIIAERSQTCKQVRWQSRLTHCRCENHNMPEWRSVLENGSAFPGAGNMPCHSGLADYRPNHGRHREAQAFLRHL